MLVDPQHLPDPRSLPTRPADTGVLMAHPEHFDVTYVINPHMEGNVGKVDRPLALRQWRALRDTYRHLGFEVHVIPGQPQLPDLVFTANQSFPVQRPDGSWIVVMSRMRSWHRVPEVPFVQAFYEDRQAQVVHLTEEAGTFEGKGDCRWHPRRRLIYGGYGFRTRKSALKELADHVDLPVVPLQLIDPRFYHLDTCLAPLTEDVALVVEEAFTPEGLAFLRRCFPELIPVPHEEAVHGFAANGNCPDGEHFVVHHGNPQTRRNVEALGIEVIELDTSEFIKSGGSVFCMSMMFRSATRHQVEPE